MRILSLLVALSAIAVLAGCSTPTDQSSVNNSIDPAPDPEILGGTIEVADSRIAFDARGEGETALVFLHCWACDREFWRHQMERFADDYRVVAFDFPGHGQTTSQRETWTIRGLAEDVRAVVEELDLQRVILVGHSMGGPVGLLAAPLMPERVVGVACVDTLHDVKLAWDSDAVAPIIAAYDQDFTGTNEQFVPSMFPEQSDAELVDWVVERANETDASAALGLMNDFPSLDFKQLFTEAAVPIRCVNAAPLGQIIPATAIETNRQYADFDAVVVEGVGHYLLLEKPQEVNDHLATAFVELDSP